MPAVRAPLEFHARSATNATSPSQALQVICAFPVSGQYGAGSRILYYVLVITCIFARKAPWLRNACLAAALVLPAVAAIHALVLASAHINGAVDLDIYGAFQICSIAILAAPLTVRLSRTYFYDPGRNIIFLWTLLILMGLVSLCVEFYRVTPVGCTLDNDGKPFHITAGDFVYGQTDCNLTCSETQGPFSPLRGGANNEIFVIPIPTRLTVNAGMLLAAGFCIPAILSLIFTWDKILEINWKRRRTIESPDEPVEGANVTVGELNGINKMVRMFLNVIEVPVFGGAVIGILSVGEANFFSKQLRWQTEPMAAVGQWAPIVGTALAAIGSLYLLWFKEDTTAKEKERAHNNYANSDASHRGRDMDYDYSPRASNADRPLGSPNFQNALGIRTPSPNQMRLVPTITEPDLERPQSLQHSQSDSEDHDLPTAGRRRIREWFTSAANHLGNAAHQKLDVSDYRDQKAHRFPEVPGEPLRNPALERISRQYSELREQNSRAASNYSPSIVSVSVADECASPTLREEAVESSMSKRRDTFETSPSRKPKRRDTLEVPAPTHRRSESR